MGDKRESILKSKRKLIKLCKECKITPEATARLVMHYIENKTIREIACVECVNFETIKQSIRRSRRALGM